MFIFPSSANLEEEVQKYKLDEVLLGDIAYFTILGNHVGNAV